MSAPSSIDPRGPRFAAALTTALLAVTLILAPSTTTLVLLGIQALLFGAAVVFGIQRTPYAWAFKTFIRPRLAPPAELEDARPPRFAQGVGLAFAVVAFIGYAAGFELVGAIATGFALAAAFLNAAFGFCLGCEMYLLIRRVVPARTQQVAATLGTVGA
jgi:hypothetical protein